MRFSRPKEIANLVTPQTLLRWFRTLVAKKYDSSRKRRVGRPRTKNEIVELVVKMAMENDRLELHQLQITDYDKIPEIFENFMNVIEEFGLNPFKGM